MPPLSRWHFLLLFLPWQQFFIHSAGPQVTMGPAKWSNKQYLWNGHQKPEWYFTSYFNANGKHSSGDTEDSAPKFNSCCSFDQASGIFKVVDHTTTFPGAHHKSKRSCGCQERKRNLKVQVRWKYTVLLMSEFHINFRKNNAHLVFTVPKSSENRVLFISLGVWEDINRSSQIILSRQLLGRWCFSSSFIFKTYLSRQNLSGPRLGTEEVPLME